LITRKPMMVLMLTQNELYLEYKKKPKQYWEFENLRIKDAFRGEQAWRRPDNAMPPFRVSN
jgi:hypothetical protein